MNKKELKAKWESVKQWCKDHKGELIMIATCGVVGGITAGGGYKKGWKDALSACDNYAQANSAEFHFPETVTARDLLDEAGVQKTIDEGAESALDKPIKYAQLWFD